MIHYKHVLRLAAQQRLTAIAAGTYPYLCGWCDRRFSGAGPIAMHEIHIHHRCPECGDRRKNAHGVRIHRTKARGHRRAEAHRTEGRDG